MGEKVINIHRAQESDDISNAKVIAVASLLLVGTVALIIGAPLLVGLCWRAFKWGAGW